MVITPNLGSIVEHQSGALAGLAGRDGQVSRSEVERSAADGHGAIGKVEGSAFGVIEGTDGCGTARDDKSATGPKFERSVDVHRTPLHVGHTNAALARSRSAERHVSGGVPCRLTILNRNVALCSGFGANHGVGAGNRAAVLNREVAEPLLADNKLGAAIPGWNRFLPP